MSTRTVTPALVAAAGAPLVSALLFVELNFASGVLRLTTAGHDVQWNGHTWLGVGVLGSVEAMTEDVSLAATGLKLTLSGVDPAIISIALQEDYQGRDARIWFAAFNDTGALVADPALLNVWRMDNMPVARGETATVELHLESEMAAWDRPRVRRFTDADQKAEHPGDRGLEFVAEMAMRTLSWGAR